MNEQGPLPVVAGEREDAQRHGLTVQEREQVERIKRAVDVTDPQEAMQYGLPAQTKIATFADTLLADVRAKDTGETGEALSELVAKVRDLDVGGLGGGSSLAKVPLVGRFVDSFNRFVARYRKIGASIEQLTIALERARMDLLKDITVLEKMYELNLDYLRQLDLYVTAARRLSRSCGRAVCPCWRRRCGRRASRSSCSSSPTSARRSPASSGACTT